MAKTMESFLTGCYIAWHANCSTQDLWQELQRIVNSVHHINQPPAPVDSIYPARCKENNPLDQKSLAPLFSSLPSDFRYKSLKACTAKFGNSSFPTHLTCQMPEMNIPIKCNGHISWSSNIPCHLSICICSVAATPYIAQNVHFCAIWYSHVWCNLTG